VAALTPDQWQELSPQLDQALALPEEERAVWLAALRLQRADLAAMIEKLLAEHQVLVQEHFLEREVLTPRTGESPGRIVGVYRLISPIGQGGMGSVWLAARNDGRFERRAAIKFLHNALIAPGSAERFKREGRILGRLAHSEIAALIDAGITENGEPYLVLEYVEGDPIDKYCDDHALGVEARIRLFLDVSSAVAHAHSNLIVHRDIKPSNVQVRNDGHVKLLDFGIAKLLEVDETSSDATQLTLENGAALTPKFAAPEQVAGGPISTATDVYSLGVLLYVLLTGRHPIGPGPHTPAELIKAILETEPARASDTFALADAESVSAKRATSSEKLRRQLRGDLDTILAKTLKKDPFERYSSVADFGDDLRRYLRHEPIIARPDAVSYRLRKYARRHQLGVAVAAGAVLLLAGFSVIQAIELRRITRERDRADRITQFMTRMFKMSDPSEARGNSVTVREVLDKASGDIGSGLTNDAETQAEMMNVMGNVYFELGLYPRAEPLFSQALNIRRRVLGDKHPDTLVSMSNLGRTLSVEGRHLEGAKLLRDTLAMQQRVLGSEHPDTLATTQRLAIAVGWEGDIAAEEKLTRQALESRRRVLGEGNADTLESMDDLAWVLLAEQRYAEAEKVQRDALNVEERVQGADNPDTLDSSNRLARILSLEGRYAEAEKLQRGSLDLERRVLGPEHTYTLRSMNNLADVLAREGNYAEAETLTQEIHTIDQRVLGPNNPTTAITTYDLGCLAALQGHRDRALSLLRESLDHGLSPRLAAGIEKNDDLKSLRGEPRFAALLDYAKQHAAATQKAK
jgi:eukaryotic-like serine/threonine-protein kinase